MGYPLFQVTGKTACNTTFSFIFGLINNKREEAFDWLCRALK